MQGGIGWVEPNPITLFGLTVGFLLVVVLPAILCRLFVPKLEEEVAE